MPADRNLPNRQRMRDAIASKPQAKPAQQPPKTDKVAAKPVATVATSPFPKKKNPRTVKAREARAAQRGRLPNDTSINTRWNGTRWSGMMALRKVNVFVPIKELVHETDGLFRLMEELDIMFWNWMATKGDEDIKALLVFAPNPPVPAPWQTPEAAAGTAPASP